jgi:hypothetical protein
MSRLPCTQLQSDHLRNENNRKWESRNSSTQNSDSENTTELDSRSECIINSVYLLMVQCTPVQLYQNTWPWCRDTTVQYHLVLRTQYIKRVRLVTVRRTERTRPITRAWSKVGTVHYPAYTRGTVDNMNHSCGVLSTVLPSANSNTNSKTPSKITHNEQTRTNKTTATHL